MLTQHEFAFYAVVRTMAAVHLWANIANLAKNQSGDLLDTLRDGFKYIETESFESTSQGLFSEINLGSEKLGRSHADKNKKLCEIIKEIATGLKEFTQVENQASSLHSLTRAASDEI